MKALEFEARLKLYLERTNTVLLSKEIYEKGIEEKKQAITDRDVLANEVVKGINILRRYEEENECWEEKIRELKDQKEGIKRERAKLEKRKDQASEAERRLEKLIEKANIAVEQL